MTYGGSVHIDTGSCIYLPTPPVFLLMSYHYFVFTLHTIRMDEIVRQ